MIDSYKIEERDMIQAMCLKHGITDVDEVHAQFIANQWIIPHAVDGEVQPLIATAGLEYIRSKARRDTEKLDAFLHWAKGLRGSDA